MRFRIRIIKNDDDPSKDLEIASSLRRDLWAHSPIELNLDDPNIATRRDTERTAYFEFETQYPDEVERVISEYGYTGLVAVERGPATASLSS